jgi:hypothetical protein
MAWDMSKETFRLSPHLSEGEIDNSVTLLTLIRTVRPPLHWPEAC